MKNTNNMKLERLIIYADGRTIPEVDDGQEVLLYQNSKITFGKLYTKNSLHIDNLFVLEKEYFETLNLPCSEIDEVYICSHLEVLNKLILNDPYKCIIDNEDSIENNEIYASSFDGMLCFGMNSLDSKNIMQPFELAEDIRDLLYTYLEGIYPEKIEEERSYNYKLPLIIRRILNQTSISTPTPKRN